MLRFIKIPKPIGIVSYMSVSAYPKFKLRIFQFGRVTAPNVH